MSISQQPAGSSGETIASYLVSSSITIIVRASQKLNLLGNTNIQNYSMAQIMDGGPELKQKT